MKRISKTTSDKLRYSSGLEAAIEQHGASLATKLSHKIWGSAAPPVSLVMIVQGLLLILRLASTRLREADARHMAELADDDPARAARDEAKDSLLTLLRSVQSTMVGTFGEAFAAELELLGELERRPDMLARRATRIVAQLRSLTPPKPLHDGMTVDLNVIADRIEEEAMRLQTGLDQVTQERVELDATMVARDKADAFWEGISALVGNFIVGLANLADEPEIASRARPTIRRLRGTSDQEDLGGEIGGSDEPEGGGDAPRDPLVDGDPS